MSKFINLFSGISDSTLEECYHQYIKIQLKKDTLENEPLSLIVKHYKSYFGDKYEAILYHNMLIEIAHRWCKCRL